MSAILKWEKKFELGVEEIDNQHKQWVAILNKFIEARKKGEEEKVLKEILSEIVDYTKYHFETEEKHMLANKYPLLEKHKIQHQALINQTAQIIKMVNVNERKAVTSLEVLLKNWVVKHILTHDKTYGEFLKERISRHKK
jgi:hemerythrin-like metal-binding protein